MCVCLCLSVLAILGAVNWPFSSGSIADVKVPSAESGGGLQSSAVKEDLKK